MRVHALTCDMGWDCFGCHPSQEDKGENMKTKAKRFYVDLSGKPVKTATKTKGETMPESADPVVAARARLVKTQDAIQYLRHARELLTDAGAVKASERVRFALKSAEGAERNADLKLVRAIGEERRAAELTKAGAEYGECPRCRSRQPLYVDTKRIMVHSVRADRRRCPGSLALP
jgi:hypothetical protein